MLNEQPLQWSKLSYVKKEEALIHLFKTQKVVECNQAFADLHGIGVNDLLGKTPAYFFGSETDEYGLKLWREMLDTGKLNTLSDKKDTTLFVPGMNESIPGTEGEKGTGLGLLIVADFMRMHEGKVYVESELNEESTFHLGFPFPCKA